MNKCLGEKWGVVAYNLKKHCGGERGGRGPSLSTLTNLSQPQREIVIGMPKNPFLFVSVSMFLILVITYPILSQEGHFLRQENSRF